MTQAVNIFLSVFLLTSLEEGNFSSNYKYMVLK